LPTTCTNSSCASVGAPSCAPLEPELPLEPLLDPLELGNGMRFPTMTPLEPLEPLDERTPDEPEVAEELEPPAEELEPPPVESAVSPPSLPDEVVACPPQEVTAT
jgi:hypothetical protein